MRCDMKTNRREFICNSMMPAAGAAGIGLTGKRALADAVTPRGPERAPLTGCDIISGG